MPNQIAQLNLAATTAATSLTASDIPSQTTQGIVKVAGTTAVRVKWTGTAAATGATGGTQLNVGDVLQMVGNNYGPTFWQQMSGVALTDGATAEIDVALFDGYDRA